MRQGFIYKIENTVNQKVYIGQTKVNIEQRWKEHLRHAPYGDQVINRAMRKYGVDNFTLKILETCFLKNIDEREIYYIAKYDSTNKNKGYNVSLGGQTPTFRRPYIDENKLIDLYVNKKISINKISKNWNISRYIIKTELESLGINIRNRWESASKYDKLDKIEIIKELEKFKSLRKTAKNLNIPYSTLRKAVIHYNIEYNSSKSVRHPK